MRKVMYLWLGLGVGACLLGCQRTPTTGQPAPVSAVRPLPAKAVARVLDPLDPAKTKDPVSALLDRAIQAFGGPSKFTRWRCGHIVYEAKSPVPSPFGDPGNVLMEEFFDYPGRFKRIMKVKLGGDVGAVVWCYSRGKAWRQIGDMPVQALPPDASVTGRHARLFLYTYDLPELRRDARHYNFAGAASVNGRAAWVLKWNGKNARTDAPQLLEALFDQRTFLLLRTHSHVSKGVFALFKKEVDSVATLEDYQEGRWRHGPHACSGHGRGS